MQIKYNAAGGHYGSRSEVRMAKGSVVRDSGIGIAREDLASSSISGELTKFARVAEAGRVWDWQSHDGLSSAIRAL